MLKESAEKSAYSLNYNHQCCQNLFIAYFTLHLGLTVYALLFIPFTTRSSEESDPVLVNYSNVNVLKFNSQGLDLFSWMLD